MEGKITKIVLKNFITYDYCELNPGPNLNMIVGPNGSGKSSIVCGIGLGLGGNLQSLGRANNISDYIKHGKDRAFIEISLSSIKRGRQSNITIQRTFKRNINKTYWKINGESKTQKEVLSLIDSYNIQIDNLCQFLPQDKVSEFSQMSSNELLYATLKAIGNKTLNIHYKELIEWQEEKNNLQADLKNKEQLLTKLKSQNDAIERDVSRYKERESILQNIKLLEARIPFAQYLDKRNQILEIINKLNKYSKKINDIEDEMNKLKKKSNDNKKKISEAIEYEKLLDKEYKLYSSQYTKLSNELEELEHENTVLLENFLNNRENEKELKEKINTRKKKVNELENIIKNKKNILIDKGIIDKDGQELFNNEELLDKNSEIGQIQCKLNEETKKLVDINYEMGVLQNKRKELLEEEKNYDKIIEQFQNELYCLDNIKNQRLSLLKMYNIHAYKAYQWIEANRSLFKMHVFSPVAIEINTSSKEAAAAVEAFIGSSLYIFVTLCKDDYDLFTEELIEKRKLKVSTVMFGNPKLDDYNYEPPIPKNELREYGFDCYLLDLIQGPDPILYALCQLNNIQSIPYCEREIKAEMYDEDPRLRKYVIKDIIYTKNIRYGSISIRTKKLKDAKILFLNDDIKQKFELENKISENKKLKEALNIKFEELDKEFQKLQNDSSNIKKERDALKEKRKELYNEKKEYIELLKQLDIAKIEYNSVAEYSLASSYSEEKINFQKKYNENILKRESLLKEYLKYKNEAFTIFNQKTKTIIDNIQNTVTLSDIDNKIYDYQNKIKNMKEKCGQMIIEKKNLKEQGLEVAEYGKSLVSNLSESDKSFIREYLLDKSVDDLQQALADNKLKLSMISENSAEIVDEYEKRKKQIEKLVVDEQNFKEKIIKLDKDIEEIKENFILRVRNIISRLSEKFSDAFEKIGCIGEIKLNEKEEYKNWGLEIFVKFRDTDNLQELTGMRQSGGERSVSTILFLMALQSFSNSPFRVVDEINQGMDSVNERLIHSQLVDAASQEGTSQYFLITPKLLPDLKYNDKMKIFCIYNGKWHKLENKIKIDKIDFRKYINKRKRTTENEFQNTHNKKIHL